jgi:hypothetical protein
VEASGNVPVFSKANTVSVSNYRPTSLPIHFSTLVEFLIYEQVSHYVKFKLNPCQHGFSKSKFTVTNLVTYLDIIVPLAGFQRQADYINFDLSSEHNAVTHTLLLHKLTAFGLSDGDANWLHSYLTNRQSQVHVSEIVSSLLMYSLIFLRDLLWDPWFSLRLLIS